ncbi:uncharacterized protein EAE98_005406 [Botrytis deweyae]|uniref:BTB domain-containing protein n=1 Tax=Botrytis deweyae TaxID=2478750 RepID=A0ABQ7INU6_9HELO|nr:uncharacterized protein EAE98_005406 [Botrytis deweyae]KAF7929488.1 hypothetical protein EAE98_005406 [Botrytis deweyae]
MSSPEKPPAEKTTTPPPTNSKKPFSSPNEMVTFIVGTGDKQETFQIHKQIACEHSEVWNRAFNSVFVEGQTQIYRIEDTGPEVFRLLTQWVYQEKFDHIHSDWDVSHSDDFFSAVECVDEDNVLLQLWVLAEKFLLHRLQNYTMRVLCNKALVCNRSLTSYDCRYVYDNTAKGSALRRFVIEHNCWCKNPSFLDGYLFSYPVEALGDIIKALKRQLPENVRARKLSQMIGDNYLVEENPTTES